MPTEITTLADAIKRAKQARTPFCDVCGAEAVLVVLDLASASAASFCVLCLEIRVRMPK